MLPFSIGISFVSGLRLTFTYGNKKATTEKLTIFFTSCIAQMLVFKKIQAISILGKSLNRD